MSSIIAQIQSGTSKSNVEIYNLAERNPDIPQDGNLHLITLDAIETMQTFNPASLEIIKKQAVIFEKGQE